MIDWKLAEQLWNEPIKEKAMVKRTYDLPEEEPESKKFDIPSEREHLLQVTDIYTSTDEIGQKLNLNSDTVSVKLEVIGGDEEGRTMLNRCVLDENDKAFFFTKMFLKAIGEPYKGKGIEIDTDRWVGRQVYATVVHNKGFANIKEYNFDKKIEQVYTPPVKSSEDINWAD